jgi:hypothetical protein
MVDSLAVTSDLLPPFEQAWAKKEADGYLYGRDALENVRFGYEIARDELKALSRLTPEHTRPHAEGEAREILAREVALNKRKHILSDTPSYAGPISPRAALRAVEAALSRPAGEQVELREALEKCRDKFREYEALHAAKISAECSPEWNEAAGEKAERNREMAEMCEAALTSKES